MKKVKYLFATIALGLALTSCGDSFLTQYPEGGLLLQEQFDKLPDNLKGSIMGIYSKLYEYGDHDTFGQRSIDMYGDIQSGDMAMKKSSYGWFEMYERGLFYAYARSYIWSFYYDIINLTNLSEMAVEDNIQAMEDAIISGETPSETIALQGYYYGQVLALRGWAYANLLNYYCDARDAETYEPDVAVIPVYTATDVKAGTLGAPLSTVEEVYRRVYNDLVQAIDLIDFYSQYNQRGSKLEIDADVARIMLAYAMLNHGGNDIVIAAGKDAYDIAMEQVDAVLANGNYTPLALDELTTTGFMDVNSHNWMWAQDVTVETTTALGSFFGQVDIHTYSYAAAGDTKGIDAALYNEIVAKKWDARINWFRNDKGESAIGNGDNSTSKAYCPDGKFYCPKTKTETALTKVDRDWLCDNVFMRIEVAYLIGAEAAWANGDLTKAVSYLQQLCDNRAIEGSTNTDYQAWLGTLTTTDAVKDAIAYNWRVEMWGEGYGLQTLRRLTKSVKLGTNHLSRGEAEIGPAAASDSYIRYQCQIPTSETRYNPKLATTVLTNKTGE